MGNIFNATVAVIGLGYVGLPLAVNFGKRYSTVGYDLNEELFLTTSETQTLPVRSLRRILKPRSI